MDYKFPNSFGDEQATELLSGSEAAKHLLAHKSHCLDCESAILNEKESFKQASKTRPLLHTAQLTAMIFCIVGGPYGLEQVVGQGGAFLAVVGFMVTPIVWAIPMALIAAEISTRFPYMGSSVIAANHVLGSGFGYVYAIWNILATILSTASLPNLIFAYLEPFIPQSQSTRIIVIVGVVVIAVLLNLRGAGVVSEANILFVSLWTAPFVILSYLALRKVFASVTNARIAWQFLFEPPLAPGGQPAFSLLRWPFKWLEGIMQIPNTSPNGLFYNASVPQRQVLWGPLVCNLLWNNSGYDLGGACGNEIASPQKTIPRSLFLACMLSTLSSFIPLLLSVAFFYLDCESNGLNPRELTTVWVDGYYDQISLRLGGEMLSSFMAIMGSVCAFAQLNALMCAYTREMSALSIIFSKTRNRDQDTSPDARLIIGSGIITLVIGLNLQFTSLINLTTLFDCGANIIIVITLLVLRTDNRLDGVDHSSRFLIPGGYGMAVLVCTPGLVVSIFVILLADPTTSIGALLSTIALFIPFLCFNRGKPAAKCSLSCFCDRMWGRCVRKSESELRPLSIKFHDSKYLEEDDCYDDVSLLSSTL
eukprot:GHVL01024448.1.p1 GENE.GHVL01024448.1~~GHVL01024448.1.p1  ORF type:complete len:591 (+),score=53.78 GHVL01024448.1:199-1971(+)